MRLFNGSRLFVRVFCAFVVAALVPLILLGIIVYHHFANVLQQNIQNTLSAISDGRAESLKDKLHSLVVIATENAADDLVVSAFEDIGGIFKSTGINGEKYKKLETQCKQDFQIYFDASNYFYDMLFISNEGNVIFSMRHESDLGANINSEVFRDTALVELFELVNSTLSTTISDFAFYPPSNQPAFFIGAPVFENGRFGSGRFLGMLVFQVKSEVINDFSQDHAGLPPSGEVVLAKLSGDEIVYVAPLRFKQDAAFNLRIKINSNVALPMFKAIYGETGIGFTKDYRGKPVLAKWQYLPQINLGMVVKVDVEQAFTSVRNLEKTIWLFCFILVIGILIMALVLTRGIVDPVLVLKKETEAIGRGELDLEVKIDDDDEIGELARAFDSMRIKLKEVHEEMAQKVKDRTNELSIALEGSERTKKAILNLMDDVEEAASKTRKLSRAVEQSPATIVITDINGKIEYVNHKFTELTGYKAEEAIGQNPRILKSGEHTQEFYKELWDTIITGEKWRGELHNKKKNNELFWEYASISSIKNAQGDITHFVAVKEDITERKSAQEQIRDSEERFRALFDNSHDAYFIMETGNEQSISACNATAEVMLRGAKNRIIGMVCDEISPEYQPDGRLSSVAIADKIREALACGRNDFEWVSKRIDGTSFWVHVMLSVLTLEGRRVLLVSWRDISERKKIEELVKEKQKELERSNKELEEFAYVVSHDLKAPLRGMASLATWLEDDYVAQLGYDGAKQIRLLKQRAMTMDSLIDGILEYSKVGRVGEVSETVDLNELVRDVIGLLDIPLSMSVSVETQLPTLSCQKVRIQQVFQNLLSNAVNYMDKEQGVIKISCQDRVHQWRFCVEDNGPGIEERHFQRIFKLFQILPIPGKVHGTGIGLSLIKKTIEMHGGQVWVESQVGQGSKFFFTLPKLQ